MNDSSSHREAAVSFRNAAGQQLIGIWHEADSGRPRGVIVMLHGWSGYRTGPHQMLTRAGRAFAGQEEADWHSFRFDFAGRGDSEGDADTATLATMADDTRAALDYCRERAGAGVPILLLGLCSGCEVAVAVAAEPGIAGLVLWSAPVFAAIATGERQTAKRWHNLKQYARKLLRPATYVKLVTGKLDRGAIKQVVVKGGGGEARNVESMAAGHLPPGWRARALKAFEGVRVPMLQLYGTADPTTHEAAAWYQQHYAGPRTVHLVEGANHSYYGLDWEREVITATRQWLNDVSVQ